MRRAGSRLAMGLLVLALGAGVAGAQSFSFSGIGFNESAYLDAADLQGVAARYTNRSITFEDVQAMMAEVRALYAARGIVTADVVLEPQDVAIGGVLQMTLVEARVGAVTLEADTPFKRQVLAETVDLPAGVPPDYDALARVVRFHEIAFGTKLGVAFSPGSVPGTADARLTMEPPAELSGQFSISNEALASVGRMQASGSFALTDKFGHLERIFGALTAHGGGMSGSLGLSVPVSSAGHRVEVVGEASTGRVIKGDFATVSPVTRRWSVNGAISQPFAVTGNGYALWRLDARHEVSRSEVAGVEASRTALSEGKAALSWSRSLPGSAFQITGAVAVGTSDSGGSTGTDGTYVMGLAEASFARMLGETFLFEASANGQFAPGQNLPSLRQFSAGGAGSLIGYPDFVSSGDSGVTSRFKLTCAPPCGGKPLGEISFAPFGFVDLGYVAPYSPAGAAAVPGQILASTGLGASMTYDALTLSGQLGKPMRSTATFDAKGQWAAYVNLSVNF